MGAPLAPWALLFWLAATRPSTLGPQRPLLTECAASVLQEAPEELVAALSESHPALQSTQAPLLTVLAHTPHCAHVAACKSALAPRTHEPGSAARVLPVWLGAEHTREQCAWLAAAITQLQPCPALALTCEPRGTRAVEPILPLLSAPEGPGVDSITLLPGEGYADEQAVLLLNCAAKARSLRFDNVLTRERADRRRRELGQRQASVHKALAELGSFGLLEHLAFSQNVFCDSDASWLRDALDGRLPKLRSFSWLACACSYEQRTASLLADCLRLLAQLPSLQSLAVTDTFVTHEVVREPWARLAAQLSGLKGLTQVVFAGTRARRRIDGGGLDLDWGAALGAQDRVAVLGPALGALTRLAELDLSGCSAGGGGALVRGLAAVMSRLRHLRALDVSVNALLCTHAGGAAATPACEVAAQLLAACAPLTALTRLNLAQCALDGAAPGASACLQALARLTGLQWLDLSRNALQDGSLLLPLSALVRLQHLRLQECQLRQGELNALAGALGALTALTCLDMSFNGGVDKEALAACAAHLGLVLEAGVMRVAQPRDAQAEGA